MPLLPVNPTMALDRHLRRTAEPRLLSWPLTKPHLVPALVEGDATVLVATLGVMVVLPSTTEFRRRSQHLLRNRQQIFHRRMPRPPMHHLHNLQRREARLCRRARTAVRQ